MGQPGPFLTIRKQETTTNMQLLKVLLPLLLVASVSSFSLNGLFSKETEAKAEELPADDSAVDEFDEEEDEADEEEEEEVAETESLEDEEEEEDEDDEIDEEEEVDSVALEAEPEEDLDEDF